MSKIMRVIVVATLSGLCVAAGADETANINPSKDNTLYQDVNGSLSNGAGEFLFCGNTVGAALRRAVIEFDIAGSIPAGATITSATLNLHMSRTITGPATVSLHKAAIEWGESTSDASGNEGSGAPALDGDCTWLHAFYHPGEGSVLWANMGGDYDPSPSASINVNSMGSYSWSSAQLAADVQAWLDDDASNHGWFLIGDEKVSSAKRFDSRENLTDSNRPTLTVTYIVSCLADFNHDTEVNFFDVQAFLQAFSDHDPSADFTHDTVFDFFDVQAFLQAFSDGCP